MRQLRLLAVLAWCCMLLEHAPSFAMEAMPPTQLHVAFAGRDAMTGDADAMVVSWRSEGYSTHPMVLYGREPWALTSIARGNESVESHSYDDGRTYHHHAVLRELEPHSKYYYTAGQPGDMSEVHSFTTARTSSPQEATPFKVGVIADLGGGGAGVSTMRAVGSRVTRGEVDWVFHTGDIAYADDAFVAGADYEGWWDLYMHRVSKAWAADTPYMVGVGNHEAECHSLRCRRNRRSVGDHLSNFTAYNTRFRMPSLESGGVRNMWYSFNYGNVHFIHISTETDYPGAPLDAHRGHNATNGPFGDQLRWLEADLRSASSAENRERRPWIIVGGHRPFYSVEKTDHRTHRPLPEAQVLIDAFEPLFIKFNVDLYLCGHIHAYERQWPVATYSSHDRYEPSIGHTYTPPAHTVHIVNGAAGCVEGLTAYDHRKARGARWNAVTGYGRRGYGVLSVLSNEKLRWDYYAFSVGGDADNGEGGEGQLFDTVVVIKS